MKKSIISLMLACTMVLSLTACTKKNDEQVSDKKLMNYEEQLAKDIEEYKKYVTLGEYKGVEISVDTKEYEVTNEKVTSYIDNIRKNKAESKEIKEGTTKKGDNIKLDYSGLLDGVAFSGGTATDVTYTVGSGRFISDLDTGLEGLEVGKEYDIPCKFPESYATADLAGKDVIFKVTVSAILESILPEYNDEFVKTIVATGTYDTKAQTTSEFTKYVEDKLKTEAEENLKNVKYEAIWDKISESSNVSGYPEEELKAVNETVIQNVKTEFSYYGSYYNINSFEDYIKQVYQFKDEAEFNNYATEYTKNYLKEKMILTMIADKEGIKVTQNEIKEYGTNIAKENGMESYQSILDQYGDDIALEMGYSVLADKVADVLLNSAKVK